MLTWNLIYSFLFTCLCDLFHSNNAIKENIKQYFLSYIVFRCTCRAIFNLALTKTKYDADHHEIGK